MADFPYWKWTLRPFGEMFRTLVDEKPPVARENAETWRLTRKYPEDHRRVDGISNHFTEDARIDSSFAGQATPREAFRAMMTNDTPDQRSALSRLTPEQLREKVYAATRECNVFNPMLARVIYQRLGGHTPRILDLSAGWGDRAIAAAACGASLYHGCDPNPLLREGYARIVEALKPLSRTVVKFDSVPAEEYEVSEGQYDIALLSPPFFTLERYVPPEALESNSQSVERYPDYAGWVEHFLRPYLANAYRGIRPGGWIVLYITDVRVPAAEGGEPLSCPLEHDSWEILRELGACSGMTFGLRIQAAGQPARSYGPSSGGRRGRGPPRGGRGAHPKAPKTRPARAWFRPPTVTPLQDKYLSVKTSPPLVELAGNSTLVVRADRFGFGSKSRFPYHLPPDAADPAPRYYCGQGDNPDMPLACLLAREIGAKFTAIVVPGGSALVAAKHAAYVSGLGGTVRRPASAAEAAQILQSERDTGRRMVVSSDGFLFMRSDPEQAAPRGGWILRDFWDMKTSSLSPTITADFGPAADFGTKPQLECLWVYYDTGTTAALLRAALPSTVRVAVMMREKAPPSADLSAFEVLGCGGREEFYELFHSTRRPGDVLWFE